MLKTIAITTILLSLVACASSTRVAKPLGASGSALGPYAAIEIQNQATEAPAHFLSAIESYLKQELSSSDSLDDTSELKVTIDIASYRMRSGFTRAMFGVFAGKDGVGSEVTVRDASGAVVGKSKVSSFNVMAIGGMEDIARMHAKEIAEFLTGKGKRK